VGYLVWGSLIYIIYTHTIYILDFLINLCYSFRFIQDHEGVDKFLMSITETNAKPTFDNEHSK
jgi:hypothetical protein